METHHPSRPPLTCDMHVDTPWRITKRLAYTSTMNAQNIPDSVMGTGRMKAGSLDQCVFALYLRSDLHDDMGFKEAQAELTRQFMWVKRQRIPVGGDFLVGLEGWRSITVDKVLEFGVKYVTLVHDTTTIIAESCTDLQPQAKGLSLGGKALVRVLQDHNVLVDLSHASPATCQDVLEITKKPVIASHSGAMAIMPHPRNLSDAIIKGIADTGGIVCLPMARRFVGSKTEMALHLEHMLSLVGPDHVGIGSDMDGAVMIPELQSAADWKSVVYGLGEIIGVPKDQMDKIAGGNVLRLLGQQT